MSPVSPKPIPSPPRSWLARSVAGFLGKKAGKSSSSAKTVPPDRPVAPTKVESALLPHFQGLAPDAIFVPRSSSECGEAARQILEAGVAGFDTEAKPTFRAGQKSAGPHVVQFALTDRAFIFQMPYPACEKVAAQLIASDQLLKVGFGLKNDHGQIRRRLKVQLKRVLDLDHIFRRKGYRGQIGVRGAIGAVLGKNFRKSKTTTTSNWAALELSPKQLSYAANDAYAALKIMEALGLSARDAEST